jgi:hypothetical protein
MRKGFTNLRDYAGEVDRFYLFKDGKTITVSDLPSEGYHPSNFLRNDEGDEGFNPPVKHIEPLGSASLQTDSFTIGAKSKHKLYGVNGLFVDDTDLEINNSYIHKNLIHEGDNSLVELGDCPEPIADEHGTVNCLRIYGFGAPVFIPEWDLHFPIDPLVDGKFTSRFKSSDGNGNEIGVLRGQTHQVCYSRASKAYAATFKSTKDQEKAQEARDSCYSYCRNSSNSESTDALNAEFPNSCIDEYSRNTSSSPTVFQRDCGCQISWQTSDMVFVQDVCGFDLLMNESDFRDFSRLRLPYVYTDKSLYSDSNWEKSLDEDLMLNVLSENIQTDIYGEDFLVF